MSEYFKRESRTLIEIADDLNDLVSELNDKIVELIREKNVDVPFSLIHCAECLFWKREWDEKNFPGNHYCPVRDKIKPPTGYCDEGVLYEAE